MIALGSVKSNIGHLKGAAGAAGVLKTALALRDKVLPPSVHCERPNPNIDFAHMPLAVNTELRPWTETVDGVRRAGVSAFGFGGTNFHVVLEEYIPHRINGKGSHVTAAAGAVCRPSRPRRSADAGRSGRHPLRARQGASPRSAGGRRRLRGSTGRASARSPERRRGGPDTGARSATRNRSARVRTRRHRFWQCRRTGGKVRQGDSGAGSEPAGRLESRCARKVFSAATDRRPKSRFSIPGKALNT